MRNKVFFIIFVVASLYNAFAELDAYIDNDGKTVFYVGERAYVSVYVTETNAMTKSHSTHTGGSEGYVLTNVSGNAPWLRFNYRDELADGPTLNTDQPYWHWRNNQVIWIELSGKPTIPDNYSGVVRVENTVTNESVELPYAFSVKPAPNSVAILSYDFAASYGRQIEQRSYLQNNTGASLTLDRPYMDYYMTRNPGKQVLVNVWSKPGNTCVQVLDCGSNHYVIRQRFKKELMLAANRTSGEFQLGLNERSSTYYTTYYDSLPEKDMIAFNGVGLYSIGNNEHSNEYLDYSYDGNALTYPARAKHRNAFYNSKMALRDFYGNLLYGSAPEWYSAGACHVANVSSSTGFYTDAIRSFDVSDFCLETDFPDNPVSSSSVEPDISLNLVTRSSSSVASPFRDLAVEFMDDNPNNKHYGGFLFSIVNKGNAEISIGGDEIRFYYNGDEKNKVPLMQDPQNSLGWDSPVSRVTLEQCEENLYVMKAKLKSNLAVPATSSFPQYYPMRIALQSAGDEMVKEIMHSWRNVSEMTENPSIVLLDASGSVLYGTEPWTCNGYSKKTLNLIVTGYAEKMSKFSYNNAAARIDLEILNKGDSVISEPIYADFQVTHPAGQHPVLEMYGKKVTTPGIPVAITDKISVMLMSSGDHHTFRFTFSDGIGAYNKGNDRKNFSFELYDLCLAECKDSDMSPYKWHFTGDWSIQDIAYSRHETDKVPIYNSKGVLLHGKSDKSAPVLEIKDDGSGIVIKHARATVDPQSANRTDAVAYSGGQLLSGGDFETPWVQGWNIYGVQDQDRAVKSIRGQSPQGSRHLFMDVGTSISQTLNEAATKILIDSGAVLTVWHKGGKVSVDWNGSRIRELAESTNFWMVDTVVVPRSNLNLFTKYVLSFSPSGGSSVALDDAVLVPNHAAQPVVYATRFTNMAGEEMESRAYDGAKEQLVTTSERDQMGRLTKKYLPFAMLCNSVVDCNSNLNTLKNPGKANSYYTSTNPDYPDAGNFAYAETRWKPDPMTSVESEGAPGAAFGIPAGHTVKNYSSGVSLDGIVLLDRASLNLAVAAVRGHRAYYKNMSGLVYDVDNYSALKDANPTHLWEMILDQNGNAAFTVKDGDGHIIVSGSLKSTGKTGIGEIAYELGTYSVNELDSRGNVVVAHPPMSCGYVNAPANCVAASRYEYDSQSRVVKSWEPDAGYTYSYYDYLGRVRATQTHHQHETQTASVVVYDDFDRPIYSGEWKTPLDADAMRAYFNNVNNSGSPSVSDLTPGTVTRTFYDRMPAIDTLSVKLYPAGVVAVPNNLRGRVAAVVSDVRAVYDEDGYAVKTSDGKEDSVVRVSTANSYDKYGRIVANYSYDPTMPADSLKMLWSQTEYDLGGKAVSTVRYPYGFSLGSIVQRSLKENFLYDRLGRISVINIRNGGDEWAELARYEYYPTGSVKSITLGNSLTISYTYHISGAVKTAKVLSADGTTRYSEELYYEDCGEKGCTPQYNGNISHMAHMLAHGGGEHSREVSYAYDALNRLVEANDKVDNDYDEFFAYDAQGRIVAQRRAGSVGNSAGGEYAYEAGSNRLKSVANGMGGTGDSRNMGDANNFVYDDDGNLIEDKSKKMKITYDWRGMPTEFVRQIGCYDYHGLALCDSTKLVIAYDGSGRRISKTRMKESQNGAWWTELVTHYTGIGTEVRENPLNKEAKVVVNMPQGLGRYGVDDAVNSRGNGKSFEWYLKNHLGSTMLVYGTQWVDDENLADVGAPIAAYDYRSFGEQVTLTESADKVTENFTGKERDDETELDYFGARYLDPMLGVWTSVDPMRQFASPYLYAGNGVNPINGEDDDGNVLLFAPGSSPEFKAEFARAIQYLNNGKSSSIIAQLHKRKEVVYVRQISEAAGDEDGFIRKDGDLNAPTIDWDPYSALTFGDGLSQSPALGFLHEADHALGYLKNPDGFNARTLESDIEYDDQEEMRVIQGSETRAAKNLGEGVRHGHDGNSKIVDHSDER